MNRLKMIIALALPLLVLGFIPLSLAVPPYPIPWKGTQINMFGGAQSISSSDYSYVAHGYGTEWPEELWSEMSGRERAFFMGPSLWFELETDPATFMHARPEHFAFIGKKGFDWMARFWWIQFKPGDLTPGTYTFTGRWYYDYELDLEITITVTVTP